VVGAEDQGAEVPSLSGAAGPAELRTVQRDVEPQEGESASRLTSSYADALRAYQDGRYAEAERLFREVAEAGGEKAGTAAIHEAHAARNGAGCQRAVVLYDEVVRRYGGSMVADEAALQAASCYQALGQVDSARKHLERLSLRPAYAEQAQRLLAALSPAEPGSRTGTAVASKRASTAAASAPAAAPPATVATLAAPATAAETAQAESDAEASKPSAPAGAAAPAPAASSADP
jgi:tetratricopeptide (TPR) repeat protein